MISAPSNFGDQPVNHVVIGRGVVAHQVHRGPIFLAGLAGQVEPGQLPERVEPLRQAIARAIAL